MKKKFKVGDLVVMKDEPEVYCYIESIRRYEKRLICAIREIGRPLFLSPISDNYFDELDKLEMTQEEVDGYLIDKIAYYHKLYDYSYDVNLNTYFPKGNITNSHKIRKRLDIK